MKSLKNIVHSIIGKKDKRSRQKFNTASPWHFSETLEDDGHCGSANNQSQNEDSDYYSDNLQSFSSLKLERNKSNSLPKRSRSCNNIKSSNSLRHLQRRDRKITQNFLEDCHTTSGRYGTDKSRGATECIKQPESHVGKVNDMPRRTTSHPERQKENKDCLDIHRTTSWSHPQRELRRSTSGTGSIKPRPSTLDDKQPFRSVPQSHSSLEMDNPRIASSEPEQIRKSSSATFSSSVKQETDQKLKDCVTLLNRLSAQVKEIKDVSKRVGYVDTKLRRGSMEKGEREKQLRELDMAEAASQRLKILVKKGVDSSSSNSSNYSNKNAAGKAEHRDQQRQALSCERPTRSDSLAMPYGGNTIPHPSHPYPQSASDMMSIWDAKELNTRRHISSGFHMTREDSTSSGYATGSGSEDGRQESANVADLDSVTSLYAMQGGMHHPESKQALTMAWKNQHFSRGHHSEYNNGYGNGRCDPYTFYNGQRDNIRADHEAIYGTYGELYAYAPSSIYEEETVRNGWYQLPSSSHHMSYGIDFPSSNTTTYNNSSNCWRYMGYTPQQVNTKYGGLSDLFYDPTAQPDATLIESIAEEVAKSSHEMEENSFKGYGSFRFRNGQRTVTMPANRGRKTVRFSQTVRRRVETEESEVEDTTSIIKGCADDNEEGSEKNAVENELLQEVSNESNESYTRSRRHRIIGQGFNFTHSQTHGPDNHHHHQQQNTHPEPIYEFPSGHIESSCMCNDCILARGSCHMRPTQAVSYFSS